MYQDAEAVAIPSCVTIICDQYPSLIREHGTDELRIQLEGLLPRIFESSEFLVDELGVEDV